MKQERKLGKHNRLSRRSFLRTSGATVGVVTLGGLLAACGDDNDEQGSNGQQRSSPLSLRVAITSSTFPSIVTHKIGPIDYGPEFGLEVSPDDVTNLDSHATAIQTVLSGGADCIVGNNPATFTLIEQGQDWKFFCPQARGNDLVLLGTNNVDSFDALLNPDTLYGTDSAGGAIYFATNAFLLGASLDQTVEDLNTRILEDGPLRTAALVNGELDATVVHETEIPMIEDEFGKENTHRIANLWDGTLYENSCYAAPSEWLDENLEAAAALCKAQLTCHREVSQTFDRYKQGVVDYVEGGADLPNDSLRILWDLARRYEFWPYNGISVEAMQFAMDVSKASGLSEGSVTAEDVIDRRPLDAALEEIGEVSVEDIVG